MLDKQGQLGQYYFSVDSQEDGRGWELHKVKMNLVGLSGGTRRIISKVAMPIETHGITIKF